MNEAPSRLRQGREVRGVLRRGTRRGGRLVSLHVREAEHERPQLAVVASRKVGRAVERNRAKRLMREAARRLCWRPGRQLVAVARPACAAADREAVEGELRRLAQELGALEQRDGEGAPGLERAL